MIASHGPPGHGFAADHQLRFSDIIFMSLGQHKGTRFHISFVRLQQADVFKSKQCEPCDARAKKQKTIGGSGEAPRGSRKVQASRRVSHGIVYYRKCVCTARPTFFLLHVTTCFTRWKCVLLVFIIV